MNKIQKAASQPKYHSFIESIINVAVGLGINIMAQHLLFPLFGIYISWGQNLQIAGIFTIISIIRSYCLRRGFNWYHIKYHIKNYETL